MKPFLTLHDPAKARQYYDAGLWTVDTFYTLLVRNSANSPDRAALRDGKAQLSWMEVKTRVDAFAADLCDAGVVPGDRLSLWMSNRLEAIIAFLACTREGIACNPSLHKSYTTPEVIGLLSELQTKALVMEPNFGTDRHKVDAAPLLANLEFLKKVYTPDTLPLHAEAPGLPQGTPDCVAYMAFTSGTTGKPKCVMHSSNTLLANARDMVKDWSLDDSAVILPLSPVSHHITWVATGQWLLSQGQLVMDSPPPGMSRLDWLLASEATYVMGVPTHAMDVLDEQKRRQFAQLGRVKTFYMAGSPIPEVVAESFVVQGIVPQNVYGMTENSSHQYTHPGDSITTSVATCGRGGPAYEVRIWDPENRDHELPRGETGEIGGRGAALMLGYFGNQSATEKTFNRHGFMMSGDLGSLDEGGNLKILGRSKDLIIRGGHNIYPAHIESLALTHTAVTKAAAFGIPDSRLGERVCLVVVGSVSPDEMLTHLAFKGLSKYDMPEWFVTTQELPLTPSGKILKRALTEMVASGALVPERVRYKEG